MTLRLIVERVGSQWLVTSPDLPGLQVAHPEQEVALSSVPSAVEALKRVQRRFEARARNRKRVAADAA